jgi:hypothetical protein
VNTNPISDLPSDQDTLNEAVGNVTFTETMTSLVAHHLLDVGEFTTPESVQPVCLALDLVGN